MYLKKNLYLSLLLDVYLFSNILEHTMSPIQISPQIRLDILFCFQCMFFLMKIKFINEKMKYHMDLNTAIGGD